MLVPFFRWSPVRRIWRSVLPHRYVTNKVYALEKRLAQGAFPPDELKRLLGEQKILLFDVGARGGIFSYLERYREILEIYVCEPEPAEAERLRAKGYKVVPKGLAGTNASRELLLTRDPGSASFLDPKTPWRLMGLGNAAKIDVVKKVPVECTRLSDLPFSRGIDFLKLDTQGLGYEILTAMGECRPLCLVTELSFVPLYSRQKTIFEVGKYLEDKGYVMVALDARYRETPKLTRFKAYPHPGMPLHCDGIFVPNWFSEEGGRILSGRLRKFAALLCIHGQHDLLMQILANLDADEARAIQEWLTPD
jgi:FkbM family methyltransferase